MESRERPKSSGCALCLSQWTTQILTVFTTLRYSRADDVARTTTGITVADRDRWRLVQSLLSSIQREMLSFSPPNPSVTAIALLYSAIHLMSLFVALSGNFIIG